MRILIIEDNEKLASSLKKGLEQEGYAVDVSLDGLAGQRKLELNHMDYDLLILDLMLPNKSGEQICSELRGKGIILPVIMLTAKDAVADKISGLNNGADDYMVKPFSFEELVARIQALARRPKTLLPMELKAGGIVLSINNQTAMKDGNNISLTLKEFRLLEFFMSHPNEVMTRQQILDHQWDFSFNIFSRVIDVHIKNLRKKIQKAQKAKKIQEIQGVQGIKGEKKNSKKYEDNFETIRGVGYKFKA
jgi:DNA-binding response OmpR family regulator